MRVAMLGPISWSTPPKHYGPWENFVSLLTEQLVKKGVDVTLFATADSRTSGKLVSVCPRPYSEDSSINPKVWECLHISELFERADEYDLIHNSFDFLPLTYSSFTQTPIVTTIHGFSSPSILPVFEKYNGSTNYVAISESDKSDKLDYMATIHHGIEMDQFAFTEEPGGYLLFFGRIHPEKGVAEAIETARKADMKLIIAGIVHDEEYFNKRIKPQIDGKKVEYIGPVGPDKRPEILGGAAALLHLISFEEPFGLSIIESMACGAPVIAYGLGAIPELLADGENGFIVKNTGEAAAAVEKIRSISRRACRAHVEKNFTSERMADKYLEVYKKIMDDRENYRPWGHYENLSERNDHKVKRIVVLPGKRLSLQKHERRAEHWVVTSGEGVVSVDGRDIPLKAGQSVDIPRTASHRILNPGEKPLVFVEVQMGDYFGEDDIIRLEDDYGRAGR